MLGHDIESSPQLYARSGGVLYLVLIVLGFYGQAILGKLVVSGDASATAINIASHESLWRVGIAAEFVALVCVTALAMIYFYLLRPVSKELNLLATFLRLVGIAIEATATMNLFAALFPLGNASSLKAFTPEQLQAMTGLALRTHGYSFGLALLFFGFTFLFHGYLIFCSGYFPRVLGILIQLGGLSYLTNSFALFLAPDLANRLFPAILLPAFVGESSLCLWLLIKGVNAQKWRLANGRMAWPSNRGNAATHYQFPAA